MTRLVRIIYAMQSLRGVTSAATAALLAIGCTSGVNAAPAEMAGSVSAGRSKELTWANYEDIKKHVQLRPAELTYQTVPWRSSAVEGLRDAQTHDKPLLLWLYFGGPRGAC
ncbi:MAG: hypothetical protein AAF449_22450 [Myxococcota bacterium]